MKTLFGEIPDDPEPRPAPAWVRRGAACWARVGNQGWSPGVILSVRLGSQTCVIEMVKRDFKPWTKHGQPRGVRSFDRIAPRDPEAKGKDKPPKPTEAAGWSAGPS